MVLSPLEQKALSKLMPTRHASLQFAKGFSNGIYGDVAVLVVFAGSSGLLGDRIKHNIHWAVETIFTNVVHNKILAAKIIAIYAYHHQANLVGKFTSNIVIGESLKAAGVTAKYLSFQAKAGLNMISLVIVGIISHKSKIQSLQTSGKLAVIAYILATGDTNLTNFKPNLWRENPPSIKEINQQYIDAQKFINGVSDLSVWLKHRKTHD